MNIAGKILLYLLLLLLDSVIMSKLSVFGVVLELNAILMFSIFFKEKFSKAIWYALIFGLFRALFSSVPFYIELFSVIGVLLFVNFLKTMTFISEKNIRGAGLIFGIAYPVIEVAIRGLFGNGLRFILVVKSIFFLSLFYFIVMPIFVKTKKGFDNAII